MIPERAIETIPWHWPRPDLSELEPEALVYWIAMNHYRELVMRRSVEFSALIQAPWTMPLDRWGGLLRRIPRPDRYPVFFGCLLEMARHGEQSFDFADADFSSTRPAGFDWAEEGSSHALPDLSTSELKILGDVATKKLAVPVLRRPWLETFPRRIWTRAIRPENPPVRRLVAALQSIQAVGELYLWDR